MNSFPRSPGVYIIRNKINNKCYVGSAINLYERYNQHFSGLRSNSHENARLQNSWNKYGSDAFYFEIIEFIEDPQDLLAFEQLYLDLVFGRETSFNLTPTAGSLLGYKASEETKQKLREACLRNGNKPPSFLGKKRTQESIDKARQSRAGWKPSPENIEKLRQSHLGIKQSPETIAKRVAKTTGKKRTPEQIERLASANRGKKRTEEQRAAMTEYRTGRPLGPATEERKKKVGDANRGKVHTPEIVEMKRRRAVNQHSIICMYCLLPKPKGFKCPNCAPDYKIPPPIDNLPSV